MIVKDLSFSSGNRFPQPILRRWWLTLLCMLLLIGELDWLMSAPFTRTTWQMHAERSGKVMGIAGAMKPSANPIGFGQTGDAHTRTSSPAQCTLNITPASLPDLSGGIAFNQTLTASGGMAPYTFEVSTGTRSLPAGLTLTPDGTLSGTPNYAATFNFTITAIDPNGCRGSRNYIIRVTATLGPRTGALYFQIDSRDTKSNQIIGMAVNESTGALTTLPGFPFETGYAGANGAFTSKRLAIDRKNLRLYSINKGPNNITAFAIDPMTGALTPLPFSPIDLGGFGFWDNMAVHPSGSPLLVATNGKLLSYQIMGATAAPAAGSPYAISDNSASNIVFSREGDYVYMGSSSLSDVFLKGFSVNSTTGVLTPLDGSPFNTGSGQPIMQAIDTTGRIFMSSSRGEVIRIFTTLNGIPSSVTGNPFFSNFRILYDGLLHPSGYYLTTDGQAMSVYRIHGNGPATTILPVEGSPFTMARNPNFPATTALSLNQTGAFLFATQQWANQTVSRYKFDSSSGTVTLLGTQNYDPLEIVNGYTNGMAYLPPPCQMISLLPSTLAGGSVSVPYTQSITAAPAGSYSYAVTAGALPAGLSLNPATGAITGSPTMAGTANFTITAINPGGCSGSQAYTLTIAQPNPAPVLAGLEPNARVAGSASFTLTVSGSNFVNASVVRWNNVDRPTAFVSGTQLTAAIPASDLASTGMASVIIFNPAPGGGTSNALTFSINNPVPTLTSLSPNSTTASNAAFTLTLTGSNFVNDSVVQWNGSARPTTFASPTQLTAAISASDIVAAGSAQVTVSNPTPGGGASNTLSFTVNNLVLSITSVTPTLVVAGGAAFMLTVNGTNFINESVVRWNGANRATTFVSATRLTAAIPAADIATAGTVRVTVSNSAPGGGVSNEAAVTIANAVASVSAASFLGAELAPESMVSAFGIGLATSTVIAATAPLPTTLAGTTVKVRDSAGVERLAPLFFVAPTQVNYLVPPGVAVGPAAISVTSSSGVVSINNIAIATVAPGLFSANASGQGVAAATVLRVKADGTQLFEPVGRFDPAQNRFVSVPIDPGPESDQLFLLLFGTGWRHRTALASTICTIGGASSEVLYAGGQGGFVGLDQLNVRLPRNLTGRGEVDVMVTVDGKTANTVKINFK